MSARRPEPGTFATFVRFSGMGLEMGAAVGLGAWGGWWLDRQVDSAPWGLLGGILLGFVAAVWMIFRSLRSLGLGGQEKSE